MAGLIDAVHEAGAWVVIIGNGLAGCWALVAVRAERARGRALWWFTAGAEASVLVQVALGVALLSGYDRFAPEMHVFYGFVAIIAVAVAYSYRQALARHLYLFYGLFGLFLMGLGIRAMTLNA